MAPSSSLPDTEPDQLQRVFQINVFGTAHALRAVAPVMRSGGGGSIVTVSSVAAHRGGGLLGEAAYAASKAALIGLTNAAARELAPHGIRVNSVAPGPVATPLLADASRFADATLLGRVGKTLSVSTSSTRGRRSCRRARTTVVAGAGVAEGGQDHAAGRAPVETPTTISVVASRSRSGRSIPVVENASFRVLRTTMPLGLGAVDTMSSSFAKQAAGLRGDHLGAFASSRRECSERKQAAVVFHEDRMARPLVRHPFGESTVDA
jgi:hypothetical protein